MKRFVLVLALAGAGCGEQVDEGEQEILDQQAIAVVKSANDVAPPVENVVPEPLLYPDIERHDIYGSTCSYAPGTSMGARVIARQADAFMKLEGEILRFAADAGARELPLETRSIYNGREFSLRLEIEGESEGTITLHDRWDRVVYSGTGTVECTS